MCPSCREAILQLHQQQARTRAPLTFWLHSPTVWIIAVNTLVFLAMSISAKTLTAPSSELLLQWGANFGPYTLGGQWYRLLTSVFLHAGILHLLLNMWALLNLGVLAELLFGRRSFVVLYLLCGLGGSIASVWWHTAIVGVGASGAIFGVAGALLPALAFHRNQRMRAAMRGNLGSIALFVLYNIAFGAASARIDNAAHLGGLLTGILLGVLIPSGLLRERRPGVVRAPTAFTLVGVLLFAAAAGARYTNGDKIALASAEHALRSGNPQHALQDAQRALASNPNLAEAHYLLGYIHLQRNELEQAGEEFQRTVAIRPAFADGYSQLCVVYLRKRAFVEAERTCQKAVSLDPKDPDKQYNLGLTEMAVRHYPAAVQSFSKAAAARPKSVDENYYFALALFMNGEQEKATAQLNKVLAIDPNHLLARDLLTRLNQRN